MEEKDYSLLRPFDLEAVKRGDFVQFDDSDSKLIYIGIPTVGIQGKFGDGCLVFQWIESNNGEPNVGIVGAYEPSILKMSPLAWIEGKPVYKGDVLWGRYSFGVYKVEAEEMVYDRLRVKHLEKITFGSCIDTLDLFTWTPPKTKHEGWVNMYPTSLRNSLATAGAVYKAKEDADKNASLDRIACIRIEWEA